MASTSSNETIIAQGVKVEGNFQSEGDVTIEGEVTGSVMTQNALRVGPHAKITADGSARTAVIAGEVKGNVYVLESLELLASSKVKGDVDTAQISVAAGAMINGKVSMGGSKRKAARGEDAAQEG